MAAPIEMRFLGTGDAFGSGGRLQSAALVDAAGTRILVDCGASSLSALRGHGADPNSVDAILLTHLHGDHFGGVPFFLMDAHYASGRTSPLVVAGPPGAESRVHELHESLFAGTSRLPVEFDLRFVELDPASPVSVAGWTVRAFLAAHSSRSACYGLRLERDGRVLAFSGDTEWTDALVDLSRDADLFVCECYGYESAPPGHLDYRTLAGRRGLLSCRRLLLTHMGDEMLRRVASLDIETVSDGLALVL